MPGAGAGDAGAVPQRFARVSGAKVTVEDVTIIGGSVSVLDAENQARRGKESGRMSRSE